MTATGPDSPPGEDSLSNVLAFVSTDLHVPYVGAGYTSSL